MSDAEDLDEALREKLRAAAELEPAPPARPELEARLVQALRQEARVTRGPRVRTAALALGFAAAAAGLIALWPRAAEEPARGATAATAACALPTGLSIAQDQSGRQQLVIPGFGALAAVAGSALSIEASEPCQLGLFLAHGELAGDLENLKPARLSIRTPHGTVVVRGTRFSVRADDEFEVVLLSGRVEIEDGVKQVLEPKHVFRKAGKTHSTSAYQAAQAQRIDELLKPAAPAPAPVVNDAHDAGSAPVIERNAPTSASTLLAQAEIERRQGALVRARALYKQASARRQEDDAEVALLRWLRLELESHAFSDARRLLQTYARDFKRGKLQAEAAWLGVALLREQGQQEQARTSAQELLRRFPGTPQADAARGLLSSP